jgi:hypothetical protein
MMKLNPLLDFVNFHYPPGMLVSSRFEVIEAEKALSVVSCLVMSLRDWWRWEIDT